MLGRLAYRLGSLTGICVDRTVCTSTTPANTTPAAQVTGVERLAEPGQATAAAITRPDVVTR